MKRMINSTLILSLILFLMPFSNVNAEVFVNENDTLNQIAREVKPLSYPNIAEIELISQVEFYGENSNTVYRMDIYENFSIFYDDAGNRLAIVMKNSTNARSIFYGNNYPRTLSYGHTDNKGSRWSNWYYVNDEDWVMRELGQLTKDTVRDLVIGNYLNYTQTMIKMTVDLAIAYADLVTEGQNWANELYFGIVYYGSTNGECDSLIWYASAPTKLVGESNNKYYTVSDWNKFTENPSYSWINNPNDYTLPAACRVIANKYPY